MTRAKKDNRTSIRDDPERLKSLLLARGNVREICEAHGVSQATYYRVKNESADSQITAEARKRAASIDARKLKTDLAVQRLRTLVLAHPAWGCDRLAAEMSIESPISGPTVQKILNEEGLRSRSDRIAYLFNMAQTNAISELTAEQLDAISSADSARVDMLRVKASGALDVVEFRIRAPKRFGAYCHLDLYVALDSYFTFGDMNWNADIGSAVWDAEKRCSPKLAALAQKAGLTQCRRFSRFGLPALPWQDEVRFLEDLESTLAASALIERGLAPNICEEIERKLFENEQLEGHIFPETLNSRLLKILLEHNTTAGKPDWLYRGQSPAQMAGFTDSEATVFLSSIRHGTA